jgi:hypothetical protein
VRSADDIARYQRIEDRLAHPIRRGSGRGAGRRYQETTATFTRDHSHPDTPTRATVEPIEAPEHIICVDCGGTCHLLSVTEGSAGDDADDLDDDGPIIAAYRCEDCLDRWDIELLAEDLTDEDAG